MNIGLAAILIVVIGLYIFWACSRDDESGPSVLVKNVVGKKIEYNYDFSIVAAVGNYSYIPLNIDGSGEEHVFKILAVLDAFEKSHTSLEVISWNLQEQKYGFFVFPYVYGIWVHHHGNV